MFSVYIIRSIYSCAFEFEVVVESVLSKDGDIPIRGVMGRQDLTVPGDYWQ